MVHFNQLKPYVPSMVTESWGGHTGTRADQETLPSQTTWRKERGPRFGSSWVFRRSRPPDLPVVDSLSPGLSMANERAHPVVSPSSAGVSVPSVLPTAVGGSQTSQLPVEATVSNFPAAIPVIEGPCSLGFPDTNGESLLSAASRTEVPVEVGQLPSPTSFMVGQTPLSIVLDSGASECTGAHGIEGGRPVRTRKPPVWFKDYTGTV